MAVGVSGRADGAAGPGCGLVDDVCSPPSCPRSGHRTVLLPSSDHGMRDEEPAGRAATQARRRRLPVEGAAVAEDPAEITAAGAVGLPGDGSAASAVVDA